LPLPDAPSACSSGAFALPLPEPELLVPFSGCCGEAEGGSVHASAEEEEPPAPPPGGGPPPMSSQKITCRSEFGERGGSGGAAGVGRVRAWVRRGVCLELEGDDAHRQDGAREALRKVLVRVLRRLEAELSRQQLGAERAPGAAKRGVAREARDLDGHLARRRVGHEVVAGL
jgi:hypothetical protein